MASRILAPLALSLAALCVSPAAAQERTPADHIAELEAARAAALDAATIQQRDLMQADLEFAADARTRHVSDAFADRFLPDGKIFPEGAAPIVGPEAVRAALAGGEAQWFWAPLEARVSVDLGVTWGIAVILYDGEDGGTEVLRTRYVTVWTRDDGGPWRIWLDMGNDGPGPDTP